jgi:hypothetical protein
MHERGGENSDLPAEKFVQNKCIAEPMRMKHVEVDWRRRELMDVHALVNCISRLLGNEWTVQLARELALV